MARYAVDASTLVFVVDEDVHVHPTHQLVAPNSIRSQALDLLLRDVMAGRRTDADALTCHERMTELKLRLLGDRVSRRTAWRIARDQDWDSLREAEYLAIAKLQADAFVTVDRDLAAKAVNLVPVASVDDLGSAG
jgi:predicted nucleic acid-binding protein